MQPEEVQTTEEPMERVVVVRPPSRRLWLHALLFLLTCFTCLVVGAKMQMEFAAGHAPFFAKDFFPLRALLADPRDLVLGIPFAASLLAILFAHEMGHFLLAVKNRVYATLPFFLPAPTPIGTFGAFIQIRSRFHTRAELLDIAIGGPIAGFVVAIPLAVLGIWLSKPLSTGSEEALGLGFPLIFHIVHLLFRSTRLDLLLLHPVAIAAWVGMLATALNLLPGGQLDGGHILFALSPRAHRRCTLFFAGVLIAASIFYWEGWLIWAIAFLLTRNHPPVIYPEMVMPASRRTLAWLALLLFVLTVTPVPFDSGSFRDVFDAYLHQR